MALFVALGLDVVLSVSAFQRHLSAGDGLAIGVGYTTLHECGLRESGNRGKHDRGKSRNKGL